MSMAFLYSGEPRTCGIHHKNGNKPDDVYTTEGNAEIRRITEKDNCHLPCRESLPEPYQNGYCVDYV